MPEQKASTIRFPRRYAPVIWTLGLLVFHVGLPFGLSALSFRRGWRAGLPSAWNLAALILVAGGIAVIISALVEHFKSAAHGWKLFKSTPGYLIVSGPYQYSRNPMYGGALAIWSGWALFYGSFAVMMAGAVLSAVIVLVVVPYEERRLTAELRESYLQYKSRVARWF